MEVNDLIQLTHLSWVDLIKNFATPIIMIAFGWFIYQKYAKVDRENAIQSVEIKSFREVVEERFTIMEQRAEHTDKNVEKIDRKVDMLIEKLL